MRSLAIALSLIMLLGGCPARTAGTAQTPGGVARTPAPSSAAPAPTPPAASAPLKADAAQGLKLLCAAIDNAKEDKSAQASSQLALELAARLPKLGSDSRLKPLGESIAAAFKRAQEARKQPTPLLLAALLRVDPQAARAEITREILGGDSSVFGALRFSPAEASGLLAPLKAASLGPAQAGACLDLLRELSAAAPPRDAAAPAAFPPPALQPLLEGLAQWSEPTVALRACGYLLRLKPGDKALHDRIWQALRDAKPGEMAAAVEAARIAGDPALADALVPLAMSVPLHSGSGGAKASAAMLYAAYALAYLPGSQAGLMRRKLSDAADETVRCQVRLGELLAGHPELWDAELKSRGIDARDIWLALEPPEAVSPLLFPTYELAAKHGGVYARGAAAERLNRYAGFQSSEVRHRAQRALAPLLEDTDPGVRGTGWYTAYVLGWPLSGRLVQDALNRPGTSDRVRLAAAGLALRVSE